MPALRADSERPGRLEGALAWGLVAAQLALRIAYAFHHAVDSDEPQHLHVAWGWASGLLPYRDVFDNHAPLFSLWAGPLVGLVGERPEIVQLARLAMLPLAALALACTWVIAKRLFSSRVALWTVAAAGLWPGFLGTSVEYRADDLWLAAWLAVVAVLVSGRLRLPRLAAAGFLLGVTLSVSLKTILFLPALGLAGFLSTRRLPRGKGGAPGRRWGAIAGALAGFALVPAILSAYFASRGAWRPLVYGVAGHNVVPGLGLWSAAPLRPLLLPLALALLGWLARRLMAAAPDAANGARRAFVFLAAGTYLATLTTLWPLVTRQDYLPFYPLAAVFLVPLLFEIPKRLASRWPRLAPVATVPWAATALFVAIELAAVGVQEPPWRDNTKQETRLLALTLQLTRPGEPLMDLKGETVFRPRPFFLALESLTKFRMDRGLARDDIARRLVATQTAVVAEDSPDFPEPARAFMDSNYLSIGGLRVLGRVLDAPRDAPRQFTIRVPQRYAVVTERGPAAGQLDGAPCQRPRVLAAGIHGYRPTPGERRVAVVWADAVERGFSPLAQAGALR